MTRVLVVDDDDALRVAVARDLQRVGFEVETAPNVEQAIGVLTQGAIDVLLTDLRMTGADGIDLLRSARLLSANTRALLMSGFGTARDYQVAVDLGAVRVLCKPFTSAELHLAVRQAAECAVGFRGSVHGLMLVDVLQMFNLARRSVAIAIDAIPGGNEGLVLMRDGALVHATIGELVGEPALRELLRHPTGTLRTTILPDQVPTTIARAFSEAVLDALRSIDEGTPDEDWDLTEWNETGAAPPAPPSPTPAPTRPRLVTNDLVARWREVWRSLHGTADPIAVAVGLDDDVAITLHGAADAATWAPYTRAMAGAAAALSSSPYGVLDCHDAQVAAFVIWDRPRGLAVLIADAVAGAGAAARLRTAAWTAARQLLERELT